jgi:predicted dehydrogenase
VRFAGGAQGTLEACRVIQGPQCQFAFEAHGTRGALAWDFERMNELSLYLAEADGARAGYRRILSGPEHPLHARFNPAPANSLGYDDLKVIEAFRFLQSVVDGRQGEPGFREALAVARVQAAVQRSWGSGSWENISVLNDGAS